MSTADPQRTLVDQAGSRTIASREFAGISSVLSGTGPPSGPEIAKFSLERLQKLGSFTPLRLGWTLLDLVMGSRFLANRARTRSI
jgi:hypothetical protein